MNHVEVTGETTKVVSEPAITARLRFQSVLFAVVQNGPEPSTIFSADVQRIVDDDPGYDLPLRSPDHAEFRLIDGEAFLVANLIDLPAKAAEIECRFLEREGEIVRITRVDAANAPGKSFEPGIQSPANQVGNGRRCRSALRQ